MLICISIYLYTRIYIGIYTYEPEGEPSLENLVCCQSAAAVSAVAATPTPATAIATTNYQPQATDTSFRPRTVRY